MQIHFYQIFVVAELIVTAFGTLQIGIVALRPQRVGRQRSLQCRYQVEGGSRSSESAPSCLLLSIFQENSCSSIFICCT